MRAIFLPFGIGPLIRPKGLIDHTNVAQSPRQTASPERLGVINGLRGLAILAVMAHHFKSHLEPLIGPYLPGTSLSLSPLIANGWTGVNLFFILSGFVLFLPYASGTRAMTSVHDAVTFYRHRFW